MSFLNLNYGVLIYSDPSQTNPKVRNGGDISKSYTGIVVSNPDSREISLEPGETQTIASTLRATTFDTTTQLQFSFPISTQTIFRAQWVGGTSPTFRTKRALGQDASTTFTITRVSPNSMRLMVTAGTGITTTSVQVGDLIRFERSTDSFTSPLTPGNAGKTWVVQNMGSNFIDFIDNQASSPEQIPIVCGSQFDSVFRVFSTGPVRIGDTISIAGTGINASNLGDYVITDMAYDYVEMQNPYGVAETDTNTSNMIQVYNDLIGFAHVIATAPVSLTFNQTAPVNLVSLNGSDAVFLGSVNAYRIDATNNTQDTVCVMVQLASLGN